MLNMRDSRQSQAPGQHDDLDPSHIYCACRNRITYCGRLTEPVQLTRANILNGPPVCSDCQRVWRETGCGICGCKQNANCERCRAL